MDKHTSKHRWRKNNKGNSTVKGYPRTGYINLSTLRGYYDKECELGSAWSNYSFEEYVEQVKRVIDVYNDEDENIK